MFGNNKSLLTVTAVIEIATGLLLLLAPSVTAEILFGAGLASPVARLVGRIGGAALITIGLTCWLERHRTDRPGIVFGLLLYNPIVAALVVQAALVDNVSGLGVWPVVGVHFVMFVWCSARLRTT